MAKLTTKTRNALPDSAFGMPKQRKYPMPDASHAANAKSRAEQAVKAGRMSESTEEKIDAKANRKIRAAGGHPGRDDGGRGRPMHTSAKHERIERRRAAGITVGRRRSSS